MTDLLTLTGAAFSSVSSLLELAKNIKNADLHDQIAELKIQIATIKNDVASLLNENRELKEELEAIKIDKENPLTYNTEDGYYYVKETKNPYCPLCYETEKIRIHIIKDRNKCPKCNGYFTDRNPVVVSSPRWDPLDSL
jgi:regulator of replication initiation timing